MKIALPTHLVEDHEKLRQLVLPMRDAIAETFSRSDWDEFGYFSDLVDEFRGHRRLYRSLSWGDEDYIEHVLWALERVVHENPGALQFIFGHAKAGAWLNENKPGAVAIWQSSSVNASSALDAVSDHNQYNVAGHVRRIRAALDSDTDLAIGSTKELLETILRHVLEDNAVDHVGFELPRLFKEVRPFIGLSEGDVTSDPSLIRLAGAMAQAVQSVAEIRNRAGTGHGRTSNDSLGYADAAFVVTIGIGVADWVARRRKNHQPFG